MLLAFFFSKNVFWPQEVEDFALIFFISSSTLIAMSKEKFNKSLKCETVLRMCVLTVYL